MKCTRFLGHKWTRWFKSLGGPSDKHGFLTRPILLTRRCVVCGYVEEVWMNSLHVVKNTDEDDTKGGGD